MQIKTMSCHVAVQLVLVVALQFSTTVSASHFRGGIFMLRPQPGGSGNEMEIFYHISWRRDSSPGGSCDATTVASGNLISGEGNLECQSGCSGTITPLSYRCTAFSAQENWSFGERRLMYRFTSVTAGNTIRIGLSGCCWISPFSSSWNLATTFSLTRRNDTNEINSTPRAVTAPVIRLQQGCNHTIPVAVTDPDGDMVRCRWAVGSSECGGICNQFPGALLNSTSCTITYRANMGVRFWAAAIMIEDFTPGSSLPLSSVALQFLVQVVSSTAPCSAPPTFVPPTPAQGTCVAIPPNTTFATQLAANSSGSAIAEIQTIAPAGTTRGALQQIVGTTTYYVNVTWTPADSQQNQIHLFCYAAVTSNGMASAQVCIRLFPGRSSPMPIPETAMPNQQLIDPSNTTWRLTFDRAIERPSSAAFITFHDFVTEEEVYRIDTSLSPEVQFEQSNEIAIKANYAFAGSKKFFIKLERGVVRARVGCGLTVNEPVENKNFWTFETIERQCSERGTTECDNALLIVACRSLSKTLHPGRSLPRACPSV